MRRLGNHTTATVGLVAVWLVIALAAACSSAAVRADGVVDDYEAIHCKAIDGIYDDADPAGHAGDIMALYVDQQEDALVLRVGMFMMRGLDGRTDWFRDADTELYVLIDYESGGTMILPDGLDARVPMMWDAGVRMGYAGRGEFVSSSFAAEGGRANRAVVKLLSSATGGRASIASGETSRSKSVVIRGVGRADVVARLDP